MGCDQETVRAAEKIILPGDRDRLGCVTQIRVRATCQRDESTLCTSKFVSDMPSHAVGLRRVVSFHARTRHMWPRGSVSACRRLGEPLFTKVEFWTKTVSVELF